MEWNDIELSMQLWILQVTWYIQGLFLTVLYSSQPVDGVKCVLVFLMLFIYYSCMYLIAGPAIRRTDESSTKRQSVRPHY